MQDGRKRVVIDGVKPEIDNGRYPAKRVIGERVVVDADAFCDGHDQIRCYLLWRKKGDDWSKPVEMKSLPNDRWRAEFLVTELGIYEYTVRGWVDHYESWHRDLKKRLEANQDVRVEMLIGGQYLKELADRKTGSEADQLHSWADVLLGNATVDEKVKLALDERVHERISAASESDQVTEYGKILRVVVDPPRARFSAWYEMFPRSCSPDPNRHGTFRDCAERIPYVAKMGFDVLYLPPIHPIGETFRKGKNNNPVCQPGDLGSPWGIGSKEGGHKAIHPELGTMKDFQSLIQTAKEHEMEVAMDVAFQCSPDHPYVKEHPDWFRARPDGTIQYAENPPKKYQDIYPIYFETEDWEALWKELKSVFDYWIEHGIRIFRVDNPHTKAFPFWEWAIPSIKEKNPDVMFLSEAFTRPKVMYRLAKLGFTQSYTYFAWRNTKHELAEYFRELTQTDVKEFFRPNVWPNTPDILTEYLQHGGRAAFMIRLVLAGTMAASYGIYGPAYELCVNQPFRPGSEEYLDSEKYEQKHWDLEQPHSLRDFIARVNRIRRNNPALHANELLRFHQIENDEMLCYSKQTQSGDNIILVVVNLNPYHTQSGFVNLPITDWGLDPHQGYQVHDLLSDARYLWHGSRNYVELNPHIVPAHVLCIRRRVRTERDFEYYL